MENNHKLIIITAPSGAGKTSITHYLLQTFSALAFSVSATTRVPRADEKNGADYYFLSVSEFIQKINDNEFAEWEMVYEGKYYGTLKSELQRIWNENKIPILDIDVKGAINIKQQYEQNCLSVFIEPPSVEELKKRLESRETETQQSLQTRLSKAEYEISFKHSSDKIIMNDDFERACEEACTAVQTFLELNKC